MEKNIKDDISSNDKSSNSSRIRSNDIDEFSANKDPNFNTYLDPKNYDISSNLSDLYNPNNNENESEKEVRYVIVNNPLLELYKSKDAIIKVEYNDCCCCSEYNNLYNVFTKVNNSNDSVKFLFQGKEYISCKDYTCCDYIKNPFTIGINRVVKAFPDTVSKSFAVLEKGCNFSCLCCGRPEACIKVKVTNKLLGTIKVPWSMGDTIYQLYNGKDQLKYIIDADYCQLGILCMKNLCCCLPEVFFEIYEPKDIGENKIVGTIQRIPGKYENFMHVLDCYQILFPTSATGEERFLLICVVFMIEFQIFRNKFGSLEFCDCGYEDTEGEGCCSVCMRHSCAGCCMGCFRL